MGASFISCGTVVTELLPTFKEEHNLSHTLEAERIPMDCDASSWARWTWLCGNVVLSSRQPALSHGSWDPALNESSTEDM